MKLKVIYECSNCGAQYPKWQGQCAECGKWNTLVESVMAGDKSKRQGPTLSFGGERLQKLSDIKAGEIERVSSGIGELDRVLGGGIVPGEVVLMVGEPGIGKSTLLTQLALSRVGGERKVVYVCGEESPAQVKLRVQRLGKKESDELLLMSETDVDVIIGTVEKNDVSLLIVDSVQTITTSDLSGQAGGVAQVKECTSRLIAYAKRTGTPVILVGHVTKDGVMAGPKVLEHMVDAVLSLSGDRYYELRLLRTVKNRFGATDEVGVFKMSEQGMEEVVNPSEVFLSEREQGASGSAVAVIMEGTRPVLVEVQALVVHSELPVPRRVAQGVDVRRVQILLGVLQKHVKLNLGTKDVFVKVAGGLTVKEPAIDLAIAMAIVSSYQNKPMPIKTAVIGEVGLLGEIRKVSWHQKRVKEAKKMGYTRIISSDKYRWVKDVVKG